jgi:hypothetical protein
VPRPASKAGISGTQDPTPTAFFLMVVSPSGQKEWSIGVWPRASRILRRPQLLQFLDRAPIPGIQFPRLPKIPHRQFFIPVGPIRVAQTVINIGRHRTGVDIQL